VTHDPVPRIIQAYRGGAALVSYCPVGGGHNLVVDKITEDGVDWCVAACLECTYYEKGRSFAEVLIGAAAKILKNWEFGWPEDGEFLEPVGRVDTARI